MARNKVFGLIINPIAGMGGKVALKGTDGQQVLAAALARGATPESHLKAEKGLKGLLPYKDRVLIYTAAGPMGEDSCKELGLNYQVAYQDQGETTAEDTMAAAKAIQAKGVDLLVFAGGDGTARNICQVVGEKLAVLGIPAGVKIQSAVFALSPEAAGSVLATIAQDIPMTSSSREVVDLDEDAYRTGHVSATLYGSMLVPDQPNAIQSMKQSGFSSENDQLRGIATYLDDHMEPGFYYAIGSGSTAKCISKLLKEDFELLGVDIMLDKKLIAKDVTEAQLWEYAQTGKLRIIVSPIGGQGFLFGRGNHQFSARVLQAVGKTNIMVISPESKLLSIPNHTMHIDCGDETVNSSLNGYYNVLCGYGYYHSLKCR